MDSGWPSSRVANRLLNGAGVATDLLLVDPSRPTTCKHRFFGRAAISAGTATFGQCFTLDATGNWGGFRQDNNGDGTWDLVQSRTSNTVNEITGVTNTTGAAWTAPAYNLAGNQLRPPSDQRGSRTEAIASRTTLPQPADPTKSYTATYDAWNRLVKLVDGANTVADYQYDGRKFRIVSRTYTAGVLSETRHHYFTASWKCIEERLGTTPDTANPNRQFVWGLRYIDDLVERDRDTGGGTLSERLYGLQDANWNMVALSNTTGAIQERYAYSPYGQPVFLTATFGSRTSSSFAWDRLFTGQTFDVPTGLHHFRNRMLHSQVGTFLTRDKTGYTDGMSLYRASFVPSRNDSTGLIPHDGVGPGGMNPWWPWRNADERPQQDPPAPNPWIPPTPSNGGGCFVRTRCYMTYVGIFPTTVFHCGFEIHFKDEWHSVDGSGGKINNLDVRKGLHDPVTNDGVADQLVGTDPISRSGFTEFPASVCECLTKTEPERWNPKKVPRKSSCNNSNWTLNCLSNRCGLVIGWGAEGVMTAPLGWNCQECAEWQSRLSLKDQCETMDQCVRWIPKPCP